MMLTGELQYAEEGRIYKFKYNGMTRIALVLEDRGDSIFCWDFTRGGFRSFFDYNVYGPVTDITNKAVITEDVNRTFKTTGVRTFINNDKLYAVAF